MPVVAPTDLAQTDVAQTDLAQTHPAQTDFAQTDLALAQTDLAQIDCDGALLAAKHRCCRRLPSRRHAQPRPPWMLLGP